MRINVKEIGPANSESPKISSSKDMSGSLPSPQRNVDAPAQQTGTNVRAGRFDRLRRPLECQVFVREDLERRVTTWAIAAFISENPSVWAHSSNY